MVATSRFFAEAQNDRAVAVYTFTRNGVEDEDFGAGLVGVLQIDDLAHMAVRLQILSLVLGLRYRSSEKVRPRARTHDGGGAHLALPSLSSRRY